MCDIIKEPHGLSDNKSEDKIKEYWNMTELFEENFFFIEK